MNGEVLFPPRWERAWSFRDGVAAVVSDLRQVDGPILRQLKKDLAFEELRGLWGLIDREGRYRCAPSFDYSETELALFTDTLYGYVDATGEFVIEPAFAYADPFHDGLAAVQSTKGMAYVDRAGAIVWSAL